MNASEEKAADAGKNAVLCNAAMREYPAETGERPEAVSVLRMNERSIAKTIDIIIPSYRPGVRFQALLRMLERQTVLPRRVFVINTEQALWDGTEAANTVADLNERETSALFGRLVVKHISREQFDHAATRAMGASWSEADAFICMTDDAVPADTHLLEALLCALYGKKASRTEHEEKTITGLSAHQAEDAAPIPAMAYARQLPSADCSELERFTREFNYPAEPMTKTKADLPRLGIKTYFASNVCCAYDRAIYRKLGGFCRTAIFNEDMIYAAAAIQAGYAVVYAADAAVVHSHNYSPMQQLHRNFDLGMSQAMHPEVFAGILSEGEGLKLVKKTAAHLKQAGRGDLLLELFVQSGCKYIGYRLGKWYRRLPKAAVHALCMNKSYVERMQSGMQKAQ